MVLYIFLLKFIKMIILKEKMRNAAVFVPRTNDFDTAEYITTSELEQSNEELKSYINSNYATKEYVDGLIGDLNNVLEQIIN